MDEITEREIVEAAKGIWASYEPRLYSTWDKSPILFRWLCIEHAYAALRAARKVGR
jgi:hypothetical protein